MKSLAALIFWSVLGWSGSVFGGDWPQWRGPQRTGWAAVGEPAPARLPEEFKPLWRISVGGGFSSPVVAGSTLVYFADANGKETVHAVAAATGKALWQTAITDTFRDEWGAGPRSTPMVSDGKVYAQACNGEVRCLDLQTGAILWQASFEKDFGVKFLGSGSKEGTATRRGNSGCGVIEGHRLILPVGGTNDCSLACVDKATAKTLWKSGRDEAAYSSFMVATLAGQKQVIAFTADALLGAALEDGKILWRVPLKTGAKRHAATPVVNGDTVTVNSQTIGLVCFKISRTEAGFEAKQLWANKPLRINVASAVLVGGSLYSLGNAKDFVCVDAATGQVRWTQPGFGRNEKDNASVVVAGNRLLVLNEAGQLVLLAANPEKYEELGRLQVCGSHWCYPAYANGRLYFRDAQELYCLGL
jgi:outer membrane protein assembly factor BamB